MWLTQRGDGGSLLAVARWATSQDDWPLPIRLSAQATTVDALLAGTPDDAAQAEAAMVLANMTELADEDSWLVPTAVRRSALLRKLNRSTEAAELWRNVMKRIREPQAWEARVLPERIRVAAGSGTSAEARDLFDKLARAYPDHPELSTLRSVVGVRAQEGE